MSTQNNYMPEGFKMTELSELPQAWSVIKLSDFCALDRGTEPGSSAYNRTGQGLPFIRVGNVAAKMQELIYTTATNVKLCNKNDILMTLDGSPGVVTKGFEGAYSSGIRKVRSLHNDLEDSYLFYALQMLIVRETIEKYTSGVTIKHASKALPHIRIPLPPLPEQKAIARVLSSIQKAIEAQDKVIAAARELKKSLMRHLFIYGSVPFSETERVPLKETEIGLIPEHWEVVRLGDVCRISTGTTPSTKRPDYYQGNIPFIKTTEIVNSVIHSASVHISEQAVKDYNLKVYEPGTVFLAMYGQGKTRGQVAFLKISAATTQNTAAIRPDSDLDARYLWLYLMSQYENLRSSGFQGQISHLNLGYVKQIAIPLPPLSEQKGIARTLSGADGKIETEEKRKASLKTLFRTMLHHLMTGKVRVKDLELTAA